MGGQFTAYDPQRCEHYAHFMQNLDRAHFDGLYWAFFFTVIAILFLASWVFQWTMMYRDKPDADPGKIRNRLKAAVCITTFLFLVAAVLLIIEVFCLLALQFCDGEDLMSLYWATWTMLQLGAEIAILGIVLALWHHLYNVRHPMWALALGTPVLVVAGFGHVISLSLEKVYKRLKAKRKGESESVAGGKSYSSSGINTSAEKHSRQASVVEEEGDLFVFVIDVGESADMVKKWPSCLEVSEGKALIQGVIQKQPGGSVPPLTQPGPSRRP